MNTRIVIVITKNGIIAQQQVRSRRFKRLPFIMCWKTIRQTIPHTQIAGLYKDIAAFLAPCWTDTAVATQSRSARRRIASAFARQVTRSLA